MCAELYETGVEYSICRNLKIFNCMMDDHRNKDMEDLLLTGRQFEVLNYVGKHNEEKVKQVMIEKEFRLSNPTVSGILNRLEKNGFIQRISLENDKRCNYIVLTQKALDLQKCACERGKAMEKKLFAGISESEKIFFDTMLNKLCKNISQMRIEQEKE